MELTPELLAKVTKDIVEGYKAHGHFDETITPTLEDVEIVANALHDHLFFFPVDAFLKEAMDILERENQ